ncbi:MAG: glycosyltransferase [Leptolyngbya sp. Prado105]|jgi:glycosyltransferase involved in cell wall biosynthesis|nr:glycosyltransferase [Leptolyngbya sp. Prado105]
MPDLAIFVHSLFGGGAERAMLNLARGFSQRGLTVDLVLLRKEGAYLDLLPSEIKIVDLGGGKLWQCLPALANYLRQNRPPVLLSTLDDTNLAAIWMRQLTGGKTRLIVNVQNTLSQEAQRSTSLKTRLMPLFTRWFFEWADAVVPVSEGVGEDLRQIGVRGDLIQVIHNPVVTPDLLERAQTSIEHPWFASEIPVLMSVGRLAHQKNYPLLLEAFAKVRQSRPVRLMILGEGEARTALEAQIERLGIEEDVLLPGFVSNPYAYLRQADLFVLSSWFEGLPTVLIEAMAVGTPVVATNCPSGPDEILAGGKYGVLVEVGNLEQLAQAIEQTLARPISSAILQERAAYYSLEQSLDRYAKVLNLPPSKLQCTEIR